MTDFDPIADLRTALEAHGPDPRDAAIVWANELPSRLLRPALRTLAVKVAPTLVGDTRRRALAGLFRSDPGSHAERDTQAATASRGRSRFDRATNVAASLGTKWKMPDGQWKYGRDMTALDLRSRAGMLRAHAVATVGQAEKCEKLAALLDEHGAATLGELPPEVLQDGLAA